ncbi:MAG TPA: hypothetical protein VNZ58_13575 [Thermomicrobiales bacterium]|nr:hypothetical protein [Thermomicrobiales bacterium]
MTTMLKERYIAAALDHVPAEQRDEVRAEIRAAIDEMVDQRIEAGEPGDIATEHVLNELGDPAKLAASYQDRPRYLIGPGWYPAYIAFLKMILGIVLPLIVVVTLLVGLAVDDKSLSGAIGDAVGAVFTTALQVGFWVTLGFAVAERVVGPEMPSKNEGRWTVADLPEAPKARQITLGGVLPDIIAMIVVAVLALLQSAKGIGIIVRSGPESAMELPLINPDLGLGWQIVFFALVALSIVGPIARYVTGFWTRRVVLLELADSALWIAYILILAVSVPIVNPEFAERVDEGATWWKTGDTANIAIAIVVILISVQTAWEAWQGYREYRRVYEGTSGGHLTAPASDDG